MRSGESSLLLSMVHFHGIVKDELGDIGAGRATSSPASGCSLRSGNHKAEIFRRCLGYRDSLLGDSSGSYLADRPESPAIVGALEFVIECRRLRSPLSADCTADKREGLYRLRRIELILDP